MYNQYDSGECTGFAMATVAEIIFGKRFSSAWYMMQSKAEGQKGDGRFIQKVLKAACNVGGVPLAEFGVLGDNTDVLEGSGKAADFDEDSKIGELIIIYSRGRLEVKKTGLPKNASFWGR